MGLPASEQAPLTIDLLNKEGEIRTLGQVELEILERAIVFYNGNMSEAARHLGIGRGTLYRKIDEHTRITSDGMLNRLKNGNANARAAAMSRGYKLHPRLVEKQKAGQ